jgi:hypothetical protein
MTWKKLVLGSVAATAVCMSIATGGFAQRADDGGRGPRVLPPLATGTVGRYIVTYLKSRTDIAQRSATVISITNNSTAVCSTSVDWKVGFGGVSCTTNLSLAPGQTGEHCSRNLSGGGLASCNATCSPEQTFIEGNAIVGSTTGTTCAKIAVYPRTFYTTGSTDQTLNGVADAKLVAVGLGNAGD